MRLRKKVGLEGGLRQIEITPLIDCVFLLLIFFMLTSNFVVVPGINVKLPKASTSRPQQVQPLIITISSEGIVYINSEPFTYKEIEKYIKTKKIKSAFLKADRDANFGVVVKVWDICKKLGVEKIGIAAIYQE